MLRSLLRVAWLLSAAVAFLLLISSSTPALGAPSADSTTWRAEIDAPAPPDAAATDPTVVASQIQRRLQARLTDRGVTCAGSTVRKSPS